MTSFFPASGSRSSTSLTATRLLFQIHNDELAIQKLQTQLSTGRRIANPSEDPAAAIKALTAQRQLEFKTQAITNLDSADVILSASESSLSQAQTILTQMRGVAVEAVGTTLSAEEKNAYVSQVQAAIAKMIELGNTKVRDQYIFGGNNVLTSPLTLTADTVKFSGNAHELLTISDYASTIAANVTANDAFGVRSERVVGITDLNPAVTPTTPLSQLNRGDGVRLGSVSINDGVNIVEFDLSNAHNLEDVIRTLESQQIGTRSLDVSLSASGINIAYADGSTGLLRVTEVGSGSTAGDLGINNEGTIGQSPVVGADLNPIMTLTTRLSSLRGGLGIPNGESMQIRQGTKTYTISTTGLNTVEDLFNRIERSGASVETSIDASGRYLQLQSTESGTSFSIGENGSNLATLLGVRTFASSTAVNSLNFGQGLSLNPNGNDLRITRSNGTSFEVSLAGVQTVGDVINRINNHVDNFTAGLRVTAGLAASGNGLTLSATPGTQPIQVENVGGSQAAWSLGLVSKGASAATGTTSGAVNAINGSDVSGVEVGGVFNSLIQLKNAIDSGNVEDMTRITAALDADLQRMSVARSVIGARQQSIDTLKDLSLDQQLQLKTIESNELDADLAEVITQLTTRQAALQASLQLMGQATRQTLFDYI